MVGLLILILIIVLIVWAVNSNKKNKMEMAKLIQTPDINYNDELLKLVTLKEKGAITELEYHTQKVKLDQHKGKIQIKDLRTLNLAKDKKEITQQEYLQLLKKHK